MRWVTKKSRETHRTEGVKDCSWLHDRKSSYAQLKRKKSGTVGIFSLKKKKKPHRVTHRNTKVMATWWWAFTCSHRSGFKDSNRLVGCCLPLGCSALSGIQLGFISPLSDRLSLHKLFLMTERTISLMLWDIWLSSSCSIHFIKDKQGVCNFLHLSSSIIFSDE